MKKILALLLAAALLLTLAGCSRSVGGTYTLEYITAEGLRMNPSGFGMNITFELSEDGVGTATYGGTKLSITWVEDGNTVVVTGPNGELKLTKDGKALILHDEGTLLFFTPKEEEED